MKKGYSDIVKNQINLDKLANYMNKNTSSKRFIKAINTKLAKKLI